MWGSLLPACLPTVCQARLARVPVSRALTGVVMLSTCGERESVGSGD